MIRIRFRPHNFPAYNDSYLVVSQPDGGIHSLTLILQPGPEPRRRFNLSPHNCGFVLLHCSLYIMHT